MQSAALPPPTTPLLWERLRALFDRVIAAIGAPALIAAFTFAPRVRTNIVRQLALVEVLARKLLLAEAAAIRSAHIERGPRLTAIALTGSGLYTLRDTRNANRSNTRAIDLTDPASWQARFALAIPCDPHTVKNCDAPRIRAPWGNAPPPTIERAFFQRNSEAFLVARRAEALRRLLHNPAPYAMRLARTRGIGVARSRETIKRYALQGVRYLINDRYDPRLSIDILSAAMRAHDVLADTS